jgi:hypothetical protein
MALHQSDAIRGAALGPFVRWYAGVYGDAALNRALSPLSERDRRRFDSRAPGLGIERSIWYPAPVVHQMLDGLLDGLDPVERRRLADAGAAAAIETSLNGVLSVVFRAVVSPRVCALVGPQIWNAFYSSGRVRIQTLSSRSHRMDVRDWGGHHAFLCQVNNAAGRAIYQAAGCRDVSTEHAACIDRGDDGCAYVIRW